MALLAFALLVGNTWAGWKTQTPPKRKTNDVPDDVSPFRFLSAFFCFFRFGSLLAPRKTYDVKRGKPKRFRGGEAHAQCHASGPEAAVLDSQPPRTDLWQNPSKNHEKTFKYPSKKPSNDIAKKQEGLVCWKNAEGFVVFLEDTGNWRSAWAGDLRWKLPSQEGGGPFALTPRGERLKCLG